MRRFEMAAALIGAQFYTTSAGAHVGHGGLAGHTHSLVEAVLLGAVLAVAVYAVARTVRAWTRRKV